MALDALGAPGGCRDKLAGRASNPQVAPLATAQSLLALKKIPAPFIRFRADRSAAADYARARERGDLEAIARHRVSRARTPSPTTPEVFAKVARNLRPSIDRLKARGVRVVFVRLATSGEHLEADRALNPRALYWDRLAEFLDVETVHFEDHSALNSFELPDTSHLDQKDAPAFTRALIEVLGL